MKKQTFNSAWFNAGLATLCAALVAGCTMSSSSGYKQADKTGDSIKTVRDDINGIRNAVDGTINALDGLVAAAGTDPRAPFEAYAKSVDKLDSAAATANKHAEKMRAQGDAYFQQWETQNASVKSEEIRKLSQERKAKVQETFSKIRSAAQDTKDSLPAYQSDLKDLRTALSSDLTVAGINASKNVIEKTKTAGAQVQKNLDKLIDEMNSVAAAVTAARVPPATGSEK
jgi:hypothetical protein